MPTATKKAVVIDACIFLEFEPIRQIDWRKLCGADEIELVLTIPVINALDKYKTDPRRQSRAERALREIREIWENGGGVREGVTLVNIDSEIRKDAFPNGYSPDSDDDQILLLLAEHQGKNQGIPVLLATDDGGMEMKCRARNIAFVRPDPSQRLPSVPDETARELQKLRLENESLKATRPIIAVGFEDSDSITNLHSFRLGIERHFEKVDLPVEARKPLHEAMLGLDLIGLESFEAYHERCVIHNEKIDALAGMCSRAFEVQLAVRNTGTAPAHNVDIHIRFSQPVFVLKEEDIEPPATPQRRNRYEGIGMTMPFPDIEPPFVNTSTRIERVGDDYQVHVKIKELKQHHPEPLPTLVIAFHPTIEARSFNAGCRITANELPKPVESELNFRLVASEGDGAVI